MEYSSLYFILVPLIVLLALWRMKYAVYTLIVLLPLERAFVTHAYGMHIKLSEWMGLLCVIAFLWNFLARPKKNIFPAAIYFPLVIFALVNIVFSLAALPDLIKFGSSLDFNSPGFRSIKVTLWCISSILLSMAVAYSIKNKRDLEKCIMVLLGSTLILCAVSLAALLSDMLGMHFAQWALIQRQFSTGIKATFSEPAYFAHYMSLILPLSVMVFILKTYRLGTAFTIAASFVLFLANYFSFSTTGLIGMTAMLFLIPYFIHHYRLVGLEKKMRYLIAIILCAYLVFLIGFLFNIDFIKVTMGNYFEKLYIAEGRGSGRIMAFKMFLDSPLIGFGPGNWAWYADQGYATKVARDIFIRPSYNCLYWEILVDLGIAGTIPFVWFFINLFRQLSKAVWRAKDLFLQAVLIGFIVGFIILLIEYYICFNFYRVYVWVFIGMAAAAIRLAKEP